MMGGRAGDEDVMGIANLTVWRPGLARLLYNAVLPVHGSRVASQPHLHANVETSGYSGEESAASTMSTSQLGNLVGDLRRRVGVVSVTEVESEAAADADF